MQNRQVLSSKVPVLIDNEVSFFDRYKPVPNEHEMMLLEYDGNNYLYPESPQAISADLIWLVYESAIGDLVICSPNAVLEGVFMGYVITQRPWPTNHGIQVYLDL